MLNEKAVAAFLVRDDVLKPYPDCSFCSNGGCDALGHRLALALYVMDAIFEYVDRQPHFVLLAAIGAVGPDV